MLLLFTLCLFFQGVCGHFCKRSFSLFIWASDNVMFQLLSCIALHFTGVSESDGMRHLAIIPRSLRGLTTPVYLVFAFPLHRHLFVEIVLYIADEEAGFTDDTDNLALCCTFLYRQTLLFRTVDTPSLASEASDGSW